MATTTSLAVAGGIITAPFVEGYKARKSAENLAKQQDDATKRMQDEARKREQELNKRMANERARKKAVQNRSQLLRDQLATRAKSRPRGGTILTKNSPFGDSIGRKSLIGGG